LLAILGQLQKKNLLTSSSIILQPMKSKFLKFFPHISNVSSNFIKFKFQMKNFFIAQENIKK